MFLNASKLIQWQMQLKHFKHYTYTHKCITICSFSLFLTPNILSRFIFSRLLLFLLLFLLLVKHSFHLIQFKWAQLAWIKQHEFQLDLLHFANTYKPTDRTFLLLSSSRSISLSCFYFVDVCVCVPAYAPTVTGSNHKRWQKKVTPVFIANA